MAFSTQVRQILRRLAHSPLFACIALLTLAVGIGANTAIFSVVYGVIIKPLPFPDADRLAGVWTKAPRLGLDELEISPSEYFTMRQENHTLEGIGMYTGDSVAVSGMARPEEVEAMDVTEDVLPLLRVEPVAGRRFTSDDAVPGHPDTVMLSYGYWQRRFGGNRGVLGSRLLIDGKGRTIIGVLPAGIRFPTGEPQLLLPFQFEQASLKLGNFSFHGIARLKPGVSFAQAKADQARMLQIMWQRYPAPPGFTVAMFTDVHMSPDIHPLKDDVIGNVGEVLWIVMAVVGMVLFIACANVANLLLVRTDGRQQELAVRMALGAGKRQLAGELLLESLMLSVIGGALGVVLGSAILRLLIAIGPGQLPRLKELSIDLPVLLFTVGISLLGGLLFGSVPVLRYASSKINLSLRQGGRTMSEGRERHRARSALVVLQVGLALVLLVSSGLMIRTFQAMRHVQPGVTDPAHLLVFRIFIPETREKTPLGVAHLEQTMLERLKNIPGVTAASVTSGVPMGDFDSHDPVFAQDRPETQTHVPMVRRYNFIAPDYFATMGNHLLAGRNLTWTDVIERRPVAIVSSTLAREYWGNPANAIGKRVRNNTTGPWREVIAVSGDEYEEGVDKPPTSAVYWPILMEDFWDKGSREQRGVDVLVRSSRVGTLSFFNAVQRAVWSLDSTLPLADPRSMQQILDKSMARTSFTMVMLGISAGMALLLGLIGIYGVISYSVSQRTREIGIRMALGAQRQTVAGMFVRHALVLVAAGLVCGALVAASVTRFLQGLLYATNPLDPLTFVAVAAVLALAGIAASYLPARRAATVDPIHSLRAD